MKQQQEAALLAAFHLMTKEERSLYVETFQFQTSGRSNQRPPLRLVVTTPPAPTKH